MAIQTIITPYEVVKYSPAGRDYPQDKICLLIPQVEQQFGYECLGQTLYDWLKDNVSAYPADAVEWEDGTNYDLGAFVVVDGCLFESLIECNRNDPRDDPDGTWEQAKRFGTDDCANELWDDYLRPILALKIFNLSVNTTTRKAGANGLTMLEGGGNFGNQGFRSSTKGEMADYKNDLTSLVEIAVSNMVRWTRLRLISSATCTVPLTSIITCYDGLCKPTSASKRRWGFKN